MIRWFVLFALALGLTVPAQAQQRVADIGIEVRIEPPGVTPPGTEGIVSITITNDGPDVGAGVFRWNQTGDVTGLSYPPLEFLGRIVGPCTISSFGQPPIGDNLDCTRCAIFHLERPVFVHTVFAYLKQPS